MGSHRTLLERRPSSPNMSLLLVLLLKFTNVIPMQNAVSQKVSPVGPRPAAAKTETNVIHSAQDSMSMELHAKQP